VKLLVVWHGRKGSPWVHWLNLEAGAGSGALLLLLGLTFDTLMDTLGLPSAQRIRHVWCTNNILVAVSPSLSGPAHHSVHGRVLVHSTRRRLCIVTLL